MNKPPLLLMQALYPTAMTQLAAAYDVRRFWEASDKAAMIDALAPSCQAVVTTGSIGIDAATIARLPQLKIVACHGVGYDPVDIHACKAAGIKVTNTPGATTECVADTAWALILATVRRIVFNDRYVRSGAWLKGSAPLSENVWGQKLGILGLGHIGKAIARRAEGFGMEIGYHGRTRQADSPYRYFETPLELAGHVKVLVVATPGGKGTEKIVGAELLRALGSEGYLVNVSRGSTVDEAALIEALTAGTIAGAGIDVFAKEPHVPEALMKLDNVVLQPHVGGGTIYTRAKMGQIVVDNLAAFFAGRPLPNEVPETRAAGASSVEA